MPKDYLAELRREPRRSFLSKAPYHETAPSPRNRQKRQDSSSDLLELGPKLGFDGRLHFFSRWGLF